LIYELGIFGAGEKKHKAVIKEIASLMKTERRKRYERDK
jgi:hypothetical protein